MGQWACLNMYSDPIVRDMHEEPLELTLVLVLVLVRVPIRTPAQVWVLVQEEVQELLSGV